MNEKSTELDEEQMYQDFVASIERGFQQIENGETLTLQESFEEIGQFINNMVQGAAN